MNCLLISHSHQGRCVSSRDAVATLAAAVTTAAVETEKEERDEQLMDRKYEMNAASIGHIIQLKAEVVKLLCTV